jgi:hypothetical protein
VSPRWGSMRIVALRFYKYVAPLGLADLAEHNAFLREG